jgi:MFS family permease
VSDTSSTAAAAAPPGDGLLGPGGASARPADVVRARRATLTVFFANGLGIGAWAASIPPIKLALGLSDGQLSLALLALAAGAVVFMPLSGPLTPRLGGTGRTTRLAALAFAVALAFPTMMGVLPLLVVSAFVLGACNGLLDVAMNAHATTVERRWGSPIMSSFHAAFSLGGLAGAGIGAALLYLGAPTGLLLVPASAVVLALMLTALPALGPGDRGEAGGPGLARPERALAGLAAVALFCLLAEGAMIDWSGLYLTTVGATTAGAAAGFASFSATMVVGRLLGDRIVGALGGPRVIAWGSLLAAAGLLLAVAIPQMPAIVAGYALVGLGLSNVVPAVFSAGGRLGSSPAAGIAAVATAGYAGFLVGPPLIGAVAAASSLRVGVAVIAAAWSWRR